MRTDKSMKKKIMNKNLLSIVLFVAAFLSASSAGGYYLDTPHNESNGILCFTCHASPVFSGCVPENIDDDCYNRLCLECHDSGGSAPEAHLHSALVMSPANRLENWTTRCVDCHESHYQGQIDWNETDSTNLYLVTGKVHFLPPYFVYDPDDGPYGSTTITLETSSAQPGWEDPATWAAKGGHVDPARAADGSRGLIFVVDRLSPKDTFEVISATATSIKVKGEVTSLPPGISFALIYGQTIRSYMDNIESHGNGDRDVRFYAPVGSTGRRGGPADNTGSATPVGICQVCHTQTTNWLSDGSGADHDQTENCFDCHTHETGFAAPISGDPEAFSQSLETVEDIPLALTLDGSDPNHGQLTFFIVDQPLHGTLSGAAPDLVYAPNLDYSGTDSFSFTVNGSTPANVDITIAALPADRDETGCSSVSWEPVYECAAGGGDGVDKTVTVEGRKRFEGDWYYGDCTGFVDSCSGELTTLRLAALDPQKGCPPCGLQNLKVYHWVCTP